MCFSLHKTTIFYNTVYSESILKTWREIFPTVSVAECDATVAKFHKLLLITINSTVITKRVC